jgi:hypothetical protein
MHQQRISYKRSIHNRSNRDKLKDHPISFKKHLKHSRNECKKKKKAQSYFINRSCFPIELFNSGIHCHFLVIVRSFIYRKSRKRKTNNLKLAASKNDAHQLVNYTASSFTFVPTLPIVD